MANRIDRQIIRYRHSVQATIDGAGAVVPVGYAGDLVIPFACTPESWFVGLDQVGSVQLDCWVDSLDEWPPGIGGTIVGVPPPSVVSALSGQGTCLDWTQTLPANSALRIIVDSVTAATRILFSLTVMRLE